jgi:outer membrane immunogenic protein
MRRIFGVLTAAVSIVALNLAAAAADLPTKAPALVPAPVLSWTGFYVGLNGGYGWANRTVSYTPNDPAAFLGTCGGSGGGTCIPPASFKVTGGLFGGQIGYNWQLSSNWLIGAEADLQWANIEGTGNSPFHLGSTDTNMVATEKMKWFGTVRARAGFIPVTPLLIYATGGFAFGEIQETLEVPNNVVGGTGAQTGGGFRYSCTTGGPPCFTGSHSETKSGWTLGGGAEYMVTPRVTLKAEYLYVNLGHLTGTTAATTSDGLTPASFTGDFGRVSFSIARAGLNYKF